MIIIFAYVYMMYVHMYEAIYFKMVMSIIAL